MGAVFVLAVSSAEEDHVLLAHIFSHSNWEFESASNCRQALDVMARHQFPVVIAAVQLCDGTWKDLLAGLSSRPVPPRLIVASTLADDSLWAQVLDLGGYDVLSKPFDSGEVIRVVSLAWRQWKHEADQAARGSDPPAVGHGPALAGS